MGSVYDEDTEYLSGRARRFVLGSTLMRDACVSRLEIKYKFDLPSIKLYERFYSKVGVAFFYIFTLLNLSTILVEYPASFMIHGHNIPFYIPLVINLLCEAYFYLRWYMIFAMSHKQKTSENISMKMTITILVLMSLDAIIYLICHLAGVSHPVRWSRALRPILLLTFPESRRLRAAFNNLRLTATDVIPVFALYIASLLFVSIVAVTIISDLHLTYPDGTLYFTEFVDAFWELYVLTTTANSPDVIVPAYEYSRVFVVLYVLVCIICNWLFMGILTACVYNSYKMHLGAFVVETVAVRKQKLDEAFNFVSKNTQDGQVGVDQMTFIRLMRIVKPQRSEDSMRMLFHILDKNRSGYLTLVEFGRLSEYTQAQLTEVELSRKYFQSWVPKFYNIFVSASFQEFKRVVEHRMTRMFFTSLIVANCITAIICRPYPAIQDAVEWFFTITFLIELIINFLACGCVHFFDSGWNIFDCVVVFGALLGQLIQVGLQSTGITIPAGVTQMILLIRLFRLLKAFSAIHKFKAVIGCIVTILPSLAAYATILLIIFYIFTSVALEFFAYYYKPPPDYIYNQTTDCGNKNLLGTEFKSWHYCIFNFNSATEAFVLLLVLTVGNNWHIFTHGYVMTTNKWSRIFFMLVHWSCVLLVLNVVLAFIIEAFLIEYDSQQSRFEMYIRERLEELGMNADIELKKRGIFNFRQPGFFMTKSLLDAAFPPDSSRSKAFYLHAESASIEILMFRMFEREVEELLEERRHGQTTAVFKAHDTLGHIAG